LSQNFKSKRFKFGIGINHANVLTYHSDHSAQSRLRHQQTTRYFDSCS
jgi:hypothetical protein